MSGSVAAVGVAVALVGLTVPALTAYSALAVRQSVAAAADAAALAGADVAVGIVAGYPCEVAALAAEANGARLDACIADGLIVSVTATRVVLGVTVTVAATAGPPR